MTGPSPQPAAPVNSGGEVSVDMATVMASLSRSPAGKKL